MLLGLADRRIEVTEKLAAEVADPRDPAPVVHSLADIVRAHILVIACGYEDSDDVGACTVISSCRCSTHTTTSVAFLPIHVYDTATSRRVAVLLRPGKTLSGHGIRGHLRRLMREIRRHWPHTRITLRGDSYYGRPEVMDWCDATGITFVFGLSGNDVLRRLVEPAADDVRVRRAEANAAVLRPRRQIVAPCPVGPSHPIRRQDRSLSRPDHGQCAVTVPAPALFRSGRYHRPVLTYPHH